ncbi:MAG: hypothetical protein RLZZ303_224 [Candidatus Hydrogenedentota bacterium]|jgi:hypothetical protein
MIPCLLPREERPFLLALLVFMILGLLLRLHGLASHSTDLEEYACTGALDAPNILQFLKDQRALYPYGAPLAPLLFYLWSGVAGDGIAAIRLFVLPFGLALIPALYWAGCVWFRGDAGRWAGLVAALLATLSPVQYMHAQEARMYAFLSLFALLSCVSMVKASRSDDPFWWRMNLLCNALVLWSHLFGLLLLATQGAWLLLFVRPGWPRLRRWVLWHGALTLPLLLWALTIPHAGAPLYGYYAPPGARTLLFDLLADDITRWSSLAFWHLPPDGNPWPAAFMALRGIFDYAALLCFVAAASWGLVRVALLYRSRTHGFAYREHILLLAWFLAPLAALALVSYIGQPVYSSRYSAHSQLALYLLAGGAVATIPRVSMRLGALATLALLMGYQMALALPSPTRTDWRGALEHVAREAEPDAVLLVEDPFWLQVVAVNHEPGGRIVEAAFGRDTLAEAATLCATVSQGREAWVLLVDIRGEGSAGFLETLRGAGMTCRATPFHGERPLHLVQVIASTPASAPPSQQWIKLAEFLASHIESTGVANERVRVAFEPDERGGIYVRLAFALLQRGRISDAAHAFVNAATRADDSEQFFQHLEGLVESRHENLDTLDLHSGHDMDGGG